MTRGSNRGNRFLGTSPMNFRRGTLFASLMEGTEDEGTVEVGLSEDQRSRHLHILGRTGSGKSKFLEALIRQDIRAGRGFLLLDPKGDLYRAVLGYIIGEFRDGRNLILVDQNEPDYTAGLHYLYEPGRTPEFLANRAMAGLSRVFGDEEAGITLRNWLPDLLKALIEADLPLADGRAFIDDPNFRAAVVKRLRDPALRQVWEQYEQNKRSQGAVELAVRNRLRPLDSGELRVLLGQTQTTLDWGTILARGQWVLVNLEAHRVSFQSQQMLGVMLLHQIIEAARRVPEKRRRRFYVYCDEFQNFICEDFARALEEMRAFELSFVLVHQHLAQLREASGRMLTAVLSQPGVRVVFNPGNYADAQVLARELFATMPEDPYRMTRYDAKTLLQLGDRQAWRHVRGQEPVLFHTPEVVDVDVGKGFLDYRRGLALKRCVRPRAEVEAEIKARREELRRRNPPRPLVTEAPPKRETPSPSSISCNMDSSSRNAGEPPSTIREPDVAGPLALVDEGLEEIA